MKLFPIMSQYRNMNTTEYIPFDIIAPHKLQAMRNHGQTLERLSERGGLSYCEALAVLEDRAWSMLEQDVAKQGVIEHMLKAQTADPILTRCSECRHKQLVEGGIPYCEVLQTACIGYCSYGERRL